MRIKYLLILFFSLVSFFSCEKGGPKYYYINNEEVKKSVSFKEGSYFIYKDSVTGVTDSIWISESNNFMWDASGGVHTEDVLEIERQEYHMINKDSLMGRVEVRACEDGCSYYEITGYPAAYFPIYTNIIPVFYSTFFQLNQKVLTSAGYTIFQKYHDSILFNGNQHYKIYQVFNKGVYIKQPYDSTAITTYYSLEEGILKYSIRTDTSYHSWEILNNHIIL